MLNFALFKKGCRPSAFSCSSVEVIILVINFQRLFAVSGTKTMSKVKTHHITLIPGDGLFLDSVRKVAAGYPDITYKEIIVDNCAILEKTKPPTVFRPRWYYFFRKKIPHTRPWRKSHDG